MGDQLKRRLLDLGFLVLAVAVGVGGFFVYVQIRNHNLLDQALIEVIQNSQPAVEQPAEVPEGE